MPDLQEIGLTALTNIERGKIFIADNPELCYVDTVDWKTIVSDKLHSSELDGLIFVSLKISATFLFLCNYN